MCLLTGSIETIIINHLVLLTFALQKRPLALLHCWFFRYWLMVFLMSLSSWELNLWSTLIQPPQCYACFFGVHSAFGHSMFETFFATWGHLVYAFPQYNPPPPWPMFLLNWQRSASAERLDVSWVHRKEEMLQQRQWREGFPHKCTIFVLCSQKYPFDAMKHNLTSVALFSQMLIAILKPKILKETLKP